MNLNLKCPNCGGVIIQNPETGKLTCTQCDYVVNADYDDTNLATVKTADGVMDKRSVEELKKISRIKRYVTENTDTIYSLDEINLGASEDSPSFMSMDVYECPSCGARLMVKTNESSSFCAYCGQPTVLLDRVEDEIEPDLIIPFAISKKKAEDIVRKRFCKGFFVPKEIKNFQVEELRPIYVPFWLTSVNVHSKIKYTYSEQKKQQRSASMLHSSTTASNTVVHHCMKDAECLVSRIPGDCSRKLNNNISRKLEPYDLSKAIPFSPEYLSGIYTDRYDVPAGEMITISTSRATHMLKDEMLSDVPYMGSLSITSDETQVKLTDIEYALLPVWFMTFKYKGISYSVAVNGQTGKVVGNVPSDKLRVGAALVLTTALFTICTTFLSVLWGNLTYNAFTLSPDSNNFYLLMAAVIFIVACVSYGVRGIRALNQSRIDIHRFRSYGTIDYIEERQEQTWVR
jgi:uncharacterized Zn finger protein (UPF0148 family)